MSDFTLSHDDLMLLANEVFQTLPTDPTATIDREDLMNRVLAKFVEVIEDALLVRASEASPERLELLMKGGADEKRQNFNGFRWAASNTEYEILMEYASSSTEWNEAQITEIFAILASIQDMRGFNVLSQYFVVSPEIVAQCIAMSLIVEPDKTSVFFMTLFSAHQSTLTTYTTQFNIDIDEVLTGTIYDLIDALQHLPAQKFVTSDANASRVHEQHTLQQPTVSIEKPEAPKEVVEDTTPELLERPLCQDSFSQSSFHFLSIWFHPNAPRTRHAEEPSLATHTNEAPSLHPPSLHEELPESLDLPTISLHKQEAPSAAAEMTQHSLHELDQTISLHKS